ncbi:sarcosine oxidase subunit delta [Paraburkholderia bonniea]|uniref:sarcosine oxidase subunit delta n=1 Tax=Paraburkholderia bonniea TaxID=2152891 RepID=UPI0012923998|nr:sarcosine oxidase subunit delta [Paraburkholderia bonniea]WJF91546.1 sarcosine oxidase subunit delta [Paraburkholderia bonniea]WJF94865.1 sarcosine oxidase subunit delta [Paraburkholderia bonniea]
MLLIECPWCGPRAESEFSCGGEADIMRPLNPEALSDKEWGDYLFMRDNPRGVHREQWLHAQGCRRWFKATRDTVTYEFLAYETFQPHAADTREAGSEGAPQAINQAGSTTP